MTDLRRQIVRNYIATYNNHMINNNNNHLLSISHFFSLEINKNIDNNNSFDP